MKTDIDIQKWLYRRIKDSELHQCASGALTDRQRPNGSELEDIVISILANESAGLIQTAFANVNIYVKDQWNAERNAWERDTLRVGELCLQSKFLYHLFGDGIRVSDKNSSQRVIPAGIVFQDGHTEHIINNKLFISINNE